MCKYTARCKWKLCTKHRPKWCIVQFHPVDARQPLRMEITHKYSEWNIPHNLTFTTLSVPRLDQELKTVEWSQMFSSDVHQNTTSKISTRAGSHVINRWFVRNYLSAKPHGINSHTRKKNKPLKLHCTPTRHVTWIKICSRRIQKRWISQSLRYRLSLLSYKPTANNFTTSNILIKMKRNKHEPHTSM